MTGTGRDGAVGPRDAAVSLADGAPTHPDAPPLAADAAVAPPDAGDRCARTHDTVALAVREYGVTTTCETMVPTMGPDLPGPDGQEVRGRVAAVTTDTVRVDRCAAGSVCDADPISEFRIAAVGLDLTRAVPEGAFVRVRYRFWVDAPGVCRVQVQVARLADWYGVANPVNDARTLYVAAGDGDIDPMPESAFVVHPEALRCGPATTPDCLYLPDTYALGVGPAAPIAGAVTVSMGEERTTVLASDTGSVTPYRARALRAFVDRCGDSRGWAWWIVAQPYIR